MAAAAAATAAIEPERVLVRVRVRRRRKQRAETAPVAPAAEDVDTDAEGAHPTAASRGWLEARANRPASPPPRGAPLSRRGRHQRRVPTAAQRALEELRRRRSGEVSALRDAAGCSDDESSDSAALPGDAEDLAGFIVDDLAKGQFTCAAGAKVYTGFLHELTRAVSE